MKVKKFIWLAIFRLVYFPFLFIKYIGDWADCGTVKCITDKPDKDGWYSFYLIDPKSSYSRQKTAKFSQDDIIAETK